MAFWGKKNNIVMAGDLGENYIIMHITQTMFCDPLFYFLFILSQNVYITHQKTYTIYILVCS